MKPLNLMIGICVMSLCTGMVAPAAYRAALVELRPNECFGYDKDDQCLADDVHGLFESKQQAEGRADGLKTSRQCKLPAPIVASVTAKNGDRAWVVYCPKNSR